MLHLKGPEESMVRHQMGFSHAQSRNHTQDVKIPPNLTDPARYRRLLHKVCGVSILVESHAQELPEMMPTCCFSPGYEESLEWDVPTDHKLRQKLGLSVKESILV